MTKHQEYRDREQPRAVRGPVTTAAPSGVNLNHALTTIPRRATSVNSATTIVANRGSSLNSASTTVPSRAATLNSAATTVHAAERAGSTTLPALSGAGDQQVSTGVSAPITPR